MNFIDDEISDEIIAKLKERCERAESRLHDQGIQGNKAHERGNKTAQQLARLVHHIRKVERKGPHQSHVFTSDEWKKLIEEVARADKMLKGETT